MIKLSERLDEGMNNPMEWHTIKPGVQMRGLKLSERLLDLDRCQYCPECGDDQAKQLISEIQVLEARAANWDLLERLPVGTGIWHNELFLPNDKPWAIIEDCYNYGETASTAESDTPEQALQKYVESRGESQ